MLSSAIMSPCSERVSVSLRIPEDLAGRIAAYAEAHSLRKTDAYLHFLRLGLTNQDAEKDRAALDRLSDRVEQVLAILEAIEIPQSVLTTQDILSVIAAVSAQYVAVRRAFLFGSFASGTQNAKSDIDIQLELDRTRRFNLRDLSRFSKDVEQATGRECDIVTTDGIEDVAFARRIETNRILAYERPQQ